MYESDPDFGDGLGDLLKVGKKYGFSFDMPLEMEGYFRRLVAQYDGSPKGFKAWLDGEAEKRFLVFKTRPKWLQNPEWPLGKSGPMVFVGQLNLPRGEVYAGVMQNHDASYYVFVDRETGQTVTIVQAT